MSLGEYLASLRVAAGMTVPDVHRALSVPRETAYSWERPNARPEPESIQRLLDLYNATDEQRLEAWRLRAEPRQQSSQHPEPTEAH